MNPNTLKLGAWWLLKAAILVSLSLVVIFLSSPKAEAATTLNGRLITNYGVPSIKVDDSIIAVDSPIMRGQIQNYIGFMVRFTCTDLRNSMAYGISSIVSTESDQTVIWQDSTIVPDATGGGGIPAPQLDRLTGWLTIHHGQLTLDISTADLTGRYSQIQLIGLSARLSDKLVRIKGTSPISVVAEGKFDVITMEVQNLWADGTLLMRDGQDY